MTNRTPHIVGGGTKTQAKDEYLRKQAAASRLAAQRDPQILMAMKHVECNKGITMDVTKMAEDDPQRVIFLSFMEEFRAARAVKGRTGKILKGAIRVSADAVTLKHKSYFEDEATAEFAVMALAWAQNALRLAGNQVHKDLAVKAKDAPKAATNVPTPARVFANKIPAANV